MSGWLLAAVLAAAEVSASEAVTAREDARLRWSVAGIAAGGVGLGFFAGGLGLGVGAELGAVVSLVAPLRVMFSPHFRAAKGVSRSGLQVFLEAQVGYELAGSRGLATTRRSPSVSLAGVIGVGFGSW